MKSVVIAGGSGIVGSRLSNILKKAGYSVFILTRNKVKTQKLEHFIHWDIENGIIDDQFAEADIIINMAGSGIAEGRWTTKRKKEAINSRLDTTQLLISEVKKRKMNIDSYISASAIGYYGDGGDKLLREEDGVQTDEFLSQVCVAWEDAASKASSITDKVCILRIGTVLSPSGGALEKMDITVPFGVANYIGNGKQLLSWIHLDDLCQMVQHCMEQPLNGIYNAVAPEVISNKDFARSLRDVINPKALVLPAPAFGVKMIFGEMARVVLNSSNVSADKIQAAGFKFSYPTIDQALSQLYPSKKSSAS